MHFLGRKTDGATAGEIPGGQALLLVIQPGHVYTGTPNVFIRDFRHHGIDSVVYFGADKGTTAAGAPRIDAILHGQLAQGAVDFHEKCGRRCRMFFKMCTRNRPEYPHTGHHTELAELFDVSCEFMQRAIAYYKTAIV